VTRKDSPPPLRGTRLLQSMGSAAEIARRLPGIAIRSIQYWQSGGIPCARYRQRLETELGIPQVSWQPAPSAFEAALASSLAGVIGEALRARHAELQPPAVAAGEGAQ
jgi:hypothetical protein